MFFMFEKCCKVDLNVSRAIQQARQLLKPIPTAMKMELLLNVPAVKISAILKF